MIKDGAETGEAPGGQDLHGRQGLHGHQEGVRVRQRERHRGGREEVREESHNKEA